MGNTTEETDFGFQFRGKEIIFSTINDLIDVHGLKNKEKVIFIGSSAGGVGILENLEELLTFVRNKGFGGIYFRAIMDGSWYTSLAWSKFECYKGYLDIPCFTEETMNAAFKLWNVQLRSSCAESNPGNNTWKCVESSNAGKTPFKWFPFFFIQNQYDSTLMASANVLPLSWDADPDDVLEHYAGMLHLASDVRSQISSLSNFSGYFSMACYNHITLLREAKYEEFPVKVEGQTLMETLKCWLEIGLFEKTADMVVGPEPLDRDG